MSSVKIKGNDNGTGILYLNAPNTNTDRTLTIPDESGTLVTKNTVNSAIFGQSSVNTTVSHNTWTKVTLGAEAVDTKGEFASSRFTPTEAGVYFVSGYIYGDPITTGTGDIYWSAGVYKNGVSQFTTLTQSEAVSNKGVAVHIAGMCVMNGTTDYLELWAYHNNSNNRDCSGKFSAFRVSA